MHKASHKFTHFIRKPSLDSFLKSTNQLNVSCQDIEQRLPDKERDALLAQTVSHFKSRKRDNWSVYLSLAVEMRAIPEALAPCRASDAL